MSIRERLIQEEGSVPYAYQDSKGIWTCGVGFNIDKNHGGRIPDEVRDFWLDFLIKRTEAALDHALPWWRSQPAWVQECMTLMAYQLGVNGLLGFKNMIAAIQAGDYATARTEALDSDWARVDSPARALRTVALLSDTPPDGMGGINV